MGKPSANVLIKAVMGLLGRKFSVEWQCVQVGVEKVTLNGRVRITLKPLMDEMPIVAAMQVRPFHWHLLIAPKKQDNDNDDENKNINIIISTLILGSADRQHGGYVTVNVTLLHAM